MLPTLAVYVLTWSVVHQLGFHPARWRRTRMWAWVTAAAGFTALAVGANVGATGVDGRYHPDPISNLSPPNLMVVFPAVAQMGSLVVLEPTLRRWCDRHRRLLGTAGAWSMTVYVWHMPALAAFWDWSSCSPVRSTRPSTGRGGRNVRCGWWACCCSAAAVRSDRTAPDADRSGTMTWMGSFQPRHHCSPRRTGTGDADHRRAPATDAAGARRAAGRHAGVVGSGDRGRRPPGAR